MCWNWRHWTICKFLFHADRPRNYRNTSLEPRKMDFLPSFRLDIELYAFQNVVKSFEHNLLKACNTDRLNKVSVFDWFLLGILTCNTYLGIRQFLLSIHRFQAWWIFYQSIVTDHFTSTSKRGISRIAFA